MTEIKFIAITLGFFASSAFSLATDSLALTQLTTIRWASINEARTLLETPDSFTRSLSPFDRAIRMGTDTPVSPETFLNYTAQQAQDWTADEAERLRTAWLRLQPRIQALQLPLPAEILMIKTNGREEPAPYTRQNAIILPDRVTQSPQPKDGLLAHELFHVLTRNAEPRFRSQLYALLGFQPCSPIQLPKTLKPRRITNPDSPIYDHFIEVRHEDQSLAVVPILLSKTAEYRSESPEPFFSYLQQQLLVLTQSADGWHPLIEKDNPVILDLDDVPDFHRQVGKSGYSVFQPDEMLARHFTKLALGAEPTGRDEVFAGLKKLLEASAK